MKAATKAEATMRSGGANSTRRIRSSGTLIVAMGRSPYQKASASTESYLWRDDGGGGAGWGGERTGDWIRRTGGGAFVREEKVWKI